MIESVAEMRLRKYAAAQRRMGDMKKQKTALVVGMARSGIGSAKPVSYTHLAGYGRSWVFIQT